MLTKDAETVWRTLHGIICVYKPPETSMMYVINTLKRLICEGLNSLETRPPRSYIDVDYSPKKISVEVRPSYADHVLCVGPRYQPLEVSVDVCSRLGHYSSGVLVVGINDGKKISSAIKKCNFTKCFQIKGMLGQASETFQVEKKILARAKYDHVDKYLMNKILGSFEVVNQRRIFEEYGVNLDSQEAYDFAVAGAHRPAQNVKGNPAIYGLKCIEFKPPHFTLEVHSVNENEEYFMNLIHSLGINLRSLAICTGIRCIRYGCFNVDHALLKKHWTIQSIIDNMQVCFDALHKQFPDTIKHVPTINASPSSGEISHKP